MGDHAGNLCCLKAELSGLRAKGPDLPFTLPMRRTFGYEQKRNSNSWRSRKCVRECAALSSLPVLFFSDISLRTHTNTLLAKRFSQQALQGGGDCCGLLLINHSPLLNYLFLFSDASIFLCGYIVLPSYGKHRFLFIHVNMTQTCILYLYFNLLSEINCWFWSPFVLHPILYQRMWW